MSPDRYAVIGQPVAHSLSPEIHAAFARLTAENLRYEAVEVPAGALAAFLAGPEGRSLAGANITLPHKEAAAGLVSGLSESARRAGAVNTLIRSGNGWRGDNTDGAGLLRDLRATAGWPLAGRRLLLIGAGGAARGILAPLLRERPAALVLCNRTRDRAETLAAEFGVRAADLEQPGTGFDGVINATAAGHAGEAPRLAPATVAPGGWCYDLSYGGAAGPFLRWALAAGVQRVRDGLGMLVEQAAESFFLWRGVRPPARDVLAMLRPRFPLPTITS